MSIDSNLSRREIFRLSAGVAALAAHAPTATVVPILEAAPLSPNVLSIKPGVVGLVSRLTNLLSMETSNSYIAEELFNPFTQDCEFEDSVKQILKGDFTTEFDNMPYYWLQGFCEALTKLSREGVSRGDLTDMFSQDPALIEEAFTAVDVGDERCIVGGLKKIPGSLEEFFGPDSSLDDIIKEIKKRSLEGVLNALDRGVIPLGDASSPETLKFAYDCLPEEYKHNAKIMAAFETIEKNRNRLNAEEREKYRQKQEQIKRRKAEERKIQIRNGVRADVRCDLRKAGSTNEGTHYYIFSDEQITVSDVHATFMGLSIYGNYKYLPFGDMKIGEDFILRQEGDCVVEVVTKNPKLIDYFQVQKGVVSISARLREPLPDTKTLLGEEKYLEIRPKRRSSLSSNEAAP